MAKPSLRARIQRYMLTGVLTLIPLWITFVVFRLILNQLSKVGAPWVRTTAKAISPVAESLAEFLTQPWVEYVLAVIATLLLLTLLGYIAGKVVGRRMLALVEKVVGKIPLVHTVYGSTKKLLSALQRSPDGTQKVVLIEFPSPEMKTVGLVTRFLTDEDTGQELAAVYVPTTPNPTSGYLEIVPVERLVPLDWTLDEAMNFIVAGGAVGRDSLKFTRGDRDADAAELMQGSKTDKSGEGGDSDKAS